MMIMIKSGGWCGGVIGKDNVDNNIEMLTTMMVAMMTPMAMTMWIMMAMIVVMLSNDAVTCLFC